MKDCCQKTCLCPSLLYLIAKSYYWENSLCPLPWPVPRDSGAAPSITSGNQCAVCAPEPGSLFSHEKKHSLPCSISVKPSLHRTQMVLEAGAGDQGLALIRWLGCSPVLPPWLQPVFSYSPPRGEASAGYGARWLEYCSRAFGTAYGAAQQQIHVSELELFF